MDRRGFFKTILLVPSLTPVLLAKVSQKGRSELYLISDRPQLVISPILQELKKFGLIQGHTYCFPNSHPHERALRYSLNQTGWRCASSTSRADLDLSFSFLREKALPSFVFIKNGSVWDIRSRELLSLWKKMNKNGTPSSTLTTFAFKNRQSNLLLGSSAVILIDGRRIETLSLSKEFSKLLRTQKGNIAVRIKEGKAWISDSSCRHKICIYSSPVSIIGERIICAPNHFLLEIRGSHSIDTSIG